MAGVTHVSESPMPAGILMVLPLVLKFLAAAVEAEHCPEVAGRYHGAVH